MRFILLDWLIEVSQQIASHVVFIYLARHSHAFFESKGFRKTSLQLVELLLCLGYEFLARNDECPSRVFAASTSGLCSRKYTKMELEILQTLKWELASITPCDWILLYSQGCAQH